MIKKEKDQLELSKNSEIEILNRKIEALNNSSE